LEHIANPIRALKEWVRVVVPHGFLLIVLPNKSSNFDHRRPVTSFEHLLSDDAMCTNEHDLTHLGEILDLHDISKDSVGSLERLKRRSQKNFENRCIHHHVFDVDLLVKLCLYLKLSVIQSDTNRTDHFILAQKTD
jgi:SAM-dependent methyltransferase